MELREILVKTHIGNPKAHAIYGDFLYKDERNLEAKVQYKKVIELDEKEIKGFFSIIKKIKPKLFDQSYIFSDSIRFYLISKISVIKENFITVNRCLYTTVFSSK